MIENEQDKSIYRSAGYAALNERYDLDVMPNWHKSLVTTSGIHRIDSSGDIVEEVYPPRTTGFHTRGCHVSRLSVHAEKPG